MNDSKMTVGDEALALGVIASGEKAVRTTLGGYAPSSFEKDSNLFSAGLVRLMRRIAREEFDRPKAPPVPRPKTYWICSGADGCIGSGVLGGPRPCPNCHKPCIETDSRGNPVEPEDGLATTAAEPGSRFMRINDADPRVDAGEIGTVSVFVQGQFNGPPLKIIEGKGWSLTVPEGALIGGIGWQRVPADYEVPSIAVILAGIRRLSVAYAAFLADPTTGAAGIDSTILEMRVMAGIEKPKATSIVILRAAFDDETLCMDNGECQRPIGHPGEHAYFGSEDQIVDRWPK